ncbi:MAG: hypothetical protein JNJ77_18195 [Planctomycetia bacterium]|nr:hypothetical protein [Planctomycetia bacterium]
MMILLIMSTICVTVQAQDAKLPSSAEAALTEYRQAFEKGDVLAIARLTSGPAGQTLRTLAPALSEAQTASDAFSKALAEKPALNLTNPFAQELNPFSGYQLELLELTRNKDEHQALVRFGKPQRMREETLSVKKEGEGYRASLPGFFLKTMGTYTQEKLTKQTKELTNLAGILKKLAEQVSKGEHSTKEAIVLKLAELIKEAKLSEAK